MIIDFHIHTRHSLDSLAAPEQIIHRAQRLGLNGVAITDHGTIAGAVEAARENDDPGFTVFIGAEIPTERGDIIGLFLTEEVQSRTCREVMDEIHAQGGLVVLPHPFKGRKAEPELAAEVGVDVVEVFNSRCDAEQNKRAAELAHRYAKPVIVGSDAHLLREIGNCQMTFAGVDFRHALLGGRIELHTTESPIYCEGLSQLIKLAKQRQYHLLPRGVAALLVKSLTGRRVWRK